MGNRPRGPVKKVMKTCRVMLIQFRRNLWKMLKSNETYTGECSNYLGDLVGTLLACLLMFSMAAGGEQNCENKILANRKQGMPL